MNFDLPVSIHTQLYQLPFQEFWSVQLIYKLPDATPDHVCHQFEMAYQFVLQSRYQRQVTSLGLPPPLLSFSPPKGTCFTADESHNVG
jgi:hypothetical protein